LVHVVLRASFFSWRINAALELHIVGNKLTGKQSIANYGFLQAHDARDVQLIKENLKRLSLI
jgi:hypothetical protein